MCVRASALMTLPLFTPKAGRDDGASCHSGNAAAAAIVADVY